MYFNYGNTNYKEVIHLFFCKEKVMKDYLFLLFFKIYLSFIYYLFLAVLGLRCCARAFSSCSKRGPLFIAMRGPFTIAASLVAEHRLQTRRLSSYGSRAQLLRDMWDLLRPGLEPVFPALAGRFSTTAPPGKPLFLLFIRRVHSIFTLLHIQDHLLYCFPRDDSAAINLNILLP